MVRSKNYIQLLELHNLQEKDQCSPLPSNCINHTEVEEDLKKKAIERGKHEGLDKDVRLKDPTYAYHNKFEDFCLFKLAYYECFKCKGPYFGGLKDCQMN